MGARDVELLSDRLRPSEAEFYEFFERCHVAMYAAAPEGGLVNANTAAAWLLGATSVAELLSAHHNIFEWRSDEADQRAFAELIERDEPARFIRTTIQSHDGGRLAVEEHACRTLSGRIVGTFALADSTEEAIDAAALEGRRFSDLYEHAAIGIYRSSRAGRPVFANPAFVRMMGYETEAEWLATHTSIEREWYVDPDRRHDFVALIEQGGTVNNFESEIYRSRTGEKIWVSETARAVRDEKGDTRYYEGTIEDITARKEIERELEIAKQTAEQANRAKSEFLANMSHELRTPLNGVIGGADIILEDEVDGTVQEFAEIIKKSGQHLLTLLNDILDLSKVEADQMAVNLETIELRPFASSLEREWSIQAERKAIGFDLLISDSAPKQFRTDETRLRQILSNLVSNAIKFTEKGRVTLSIFCPEGGAPSVSFAVGDTGCGVPEEALERIFDRFEQADGSTTRKYGGTGLGLALSRCFSELLGGALTCRSTLGEGSLFTLSLPAVAPETLRRGEQATADRRRPGARRAKSRTAGQAAANVLVVDDNEMNGAVASKMLRQLGYAAHVVTDGAAAIAAFKVHDFHAVLMDVNMPGMNGVEATAALRALGGGKGEIQIVALTANAMAGDRERLLAAGMDAYLAKPITVESLRATLDALDHGHRPA